MPELEYITTRFATIHEQHQRLFQGEVVVVMIRRKWELSPRWELDDWEQWVVTNCFTILKRGIHPLDVVIIDYIWYELKSQIIERRKDYGEIAPGVIHPELRQIFQTLLARMIYLRSRHPNRAQVQKVIENIYDYLLEH